MDTLLSPRELADALGVSESSIKRWVDGGELEALRTAGGHRRITRREALRFARANCVIPVRPELLSAVGLKIGDTSLSDDDRNIAFHRALLEDDRPRAFSILTSAFLAGSSVASLSDGPIRFALERIGELWKHEERGILLEHRAMDLCLHGLALLRSALPTPAGDAPVAVGSAGPEDPYLIPSMMCAVVLCEAGFRDVNLGPRTPIATKLSAIDSYRPMLVWHTSSVGGEEIAPLVTAIRRSSSSEVRVVVGGRAASATSLPSGVVPLTSMRELEVYARGLLPARKIAAG